MIITEYYKEREDGVKLYRTYSDAGMKILQNETGIVYEDALDVPAMGYTYTETTIPIENSDITAEEALNILLGGESNE